MMKILNRLQVIEEDELTLLTLEKLLDFSKPVSALTQ